MYMFCARIPTHSKSQVRNNSRTWTINPKWHSQIVFQIEFGTKENQKFVTLQNCRQGSGFWNNPGRHWQGESWIWNRYLIRTNQLNSYMFCTRVVTISLDVFLIWHTWISKRTISHYRAFAHMTQLVHIFWFVRKIIDELNRQSTEINI